MKQSCRWRLDIWLFLLGVLSAQCQTQVVIPQQYANSAANTGDVTPLGAQNQHMQQVYAGSLLAASGLNLGDQITAIGFRLDEGETSLAAQTVSDYSIWLGQSVFSPGNLSSNFTANGSGMTLVRSGALNIADGQFPGGTGLNPFGMIQFSTPYTYLGGNLLIEIICGDFFNGVNVDAEYPFNPSLAQTAFGTGPASTTADQGLYNEAIIISLAVIPATSAPEPSTMAMLTCGLLGLIFIARRRN